MDKNCVIKIMSAQQQLQAIPILDTVAKNQQRQQLRQPVNNNGKQVHCTKQVIFNHETLYINSDDYSSSPSFLKMSIQNTPMLKKNNLSQYSKQFNKQQIDILDLQQLNLNDQIYQSKQPNIKNMETTIKTCKKQPINNQQFYTQNSVDKTNKQNVNTFRNKKIYRYGDINWGLYEMDNLIKIVDNMYEKAIEKKIQTNVNLEISKNKNNFLKQVRLNGNQVKNTNKQQVKKEVVLIQIQQLKQKAKNRQNKKKQSILNSENLSKQNYQKYCKIIQQQQDSRHISQTQRVSIQILPQQDQYQYKFKQQQPQDQHFIQQNNLLPTSTVKSHTQSLGLQFNNFQQSQQFSYHYFQSQGSEQIKQKQNINCKTLSRKQQNTKQIITIKNLDKKQQKSKTNLLNYTVSKYNQTLKTKATKNQPTQQLKPKIYTIITKNNSRQNKQTQPISQIPIQHNHTYKTNTTQGNGKRVYEQILSEYTTAKLLAISKKQYKGHHKNINKINVQQCQQQINNKRRSSSLTNEPKHIHCSQNRFVSQQKINKNMNNNKNNHPIKFIKKIDSSNSLQKQVKNISKKFIQPITNVKMEICQFGSNFSLNSTKR